MGYWTQRQWAAEREGRTIESYADLDAAAPAAEPEDKPKSKAKRKRTKKSED